MIRYQPDKHHPLGPSSWPAWAQCAAYEPDRDDDDVAEDDGSADTYPSEAALRGILQHAAYAALLVQDKPAADAAAQELTEHELEEVHWAVRHTLTLVEETGFSRDDIRVERRVTLFGEDGIEPVYFGTLDVCWGGRCIADAKFGEVRDYFAQLVGYALPLIEAGKTESVDAFVVYARHRRSRRYHIDAETARRVGYGILRKRTAAYSHPTPCEYCGWCRLAASCPAINATVEAVARLRPEVPEWLTLASARNHDIASDPLLAGKARYLWKAFLEKWGAGVEFATRTMALKGTPPVGFSVVKRAGTKKVVNASAAIQACEQLGVPREALDEAISVSFGGLAMAVQRSLGWPKSDAENALVEALRKVGAVQFQPETIMLRAKKGIKEELAAASALPVQQLPRQDEEA